MRASAAVALLAALLALGCRTGRDGDAVTIHFWAMGAEGDKVQPLVREFERQHPGIRVQVQQIPWTAAHEKLLTAQVGDATPDVAQLGNTWVPEFVALNALVPLDSFVASSHVVTPDGFFPGIWETNVVDDTVYGIPWYVDTRVIFYRTDLLRRAGYDSMPATWEEWREAMRRIREQGGPGQYAIFLPTNEWPQPVILGMQMGSPLLADGGRYGAFSRPEFRRGFEFYVSLYRDSLAPAIGANQISNIFQEFERGTFAMMITGPWMLDEFRRRLPESMQDQWSTAPMPGPGGEETRVSMAGGASLVLFRGSEHRREAWRLIEFLSQPEQQVRFYQLTRDLPARVEAWEDTVLTNDPKVQAFGQQLRRVVPLPKVPEIELVVTRVFDQVEKVVRGGVPIPRALEELDAEVNRILEKRRWILARQERQRQ